MEKAGGFTLIELIVTVAVAGILLTVAIPSYRYIVTTNRMAAEINDFVTSFYFARSQAVKLGQFVTLCASEDGKACTGDNAAWTPGWIIFADPDNNQTVNSGEKVLAVNAGVTHGDTLTGDSHTSGVLTFSGNGFIPGANNGTITLNDQQGDESYRRCVVLSYGGRLRIGSNCP